MVDCSIYNESYSYKGDRKETLKKQRFEEYEVFEIVKNKLLPEFAEKYHNLMLQHKNAEADDCIAVCVNQLRTKNFKKDIWIVASDLDYLQLCQNGTYLIDLKRKQLDTKHLVDNNISAQDYLLRKIMIGDKSDNIFPCQFNPDYISNINELCNIKLRKNKQGNFTITNKTFEKIRNCNVIWKTITEYFNKNKIIILENKKQKNTLLYINQDIFDINQRLIDFDLIPKTIKSKIKIS